MRDASAYAALGLEPGADPVTIERAYKRLIKLHHPDVEGGDADRAAEINRAYTELRSRYAPQDSVILAHEQPHREPRGSGWVGAAVLLIIAIALGLAMIGPLRDFLPLATGSGPAGDIPPAHSSGSLNQPVHQAAIDGAVKVAVHLAARHDDSRLLSASRDCHRALRLEPSVTQLDRCAAFDDAVVVLQDREPMWDRGPFSQIAVTNRQWSAASALSNDYLAIDSRLDRIRLQVELALGPPEPPQPPPPVPLMPVIDQTDPLAMNAVGNVLENRPQD